MNKEDYFKYYIQGSDHYLIPRDIFEELFNEMNNWKNETKELKRQLEYLRSGEYLNQLKYERNLLESIVQDYEVSKEDKEFIDMTHRNTELLEQINKAIEYIKDSYVEVLKYYDEPSETASYELVTIDLLKILGGDVDDE